MPGPPLNLLCVEPHFPGRLGCAADWLARKRGYRCHFAFHGVADEPFWPADARATLNLVRFNVGGVAREAAVPWTRHLERGLCYAFGAWEVIDAARSRPVDVILARSAGLGSSLFLPVSYPRVPIVQQFDYYLQPRTGDLAPEDTHDLPDDYRMWRRSSNAMDLLDLENGVVGFTHTHWQRGLFPLEYQADLRVIDDGIDARNAPPRHRGPLNIGGKTIPPEMKVVTFVSAVPDRVRGFDRFVRLASRLLDERADVLCVVAGGGTVGRMLDVRHFGVDYAAQATETAGLAEHERFWRVGPLQPAVLQSLLARSDLHVAPGRPYPLARSLLLAMGCGAPVLATPTPPFLELFAADLPEWITADDRDETLWDGARQALDDPAAQSRIASRAVALMHDRFDNEVVLPRLAELLEEAAGLAASTIIQPGA